MKNDGKSGASAAFAGVAGDGRDDHAGMDIQLPEDAVGVIRAVALPGNQEVAVGLHADRRLILTIECGAVDRAGGQWIAIGIEVADVDALVAAVLVVAGPGDDESAGAIDADGGFVLIIKSDDVCQDFAADGVAGAVIAAHIDAFFVSILIVAACPGDDVCA